MANTLKFGNGQWATGNGTALAYNDENSNFKPLPFDFTRASSGTVVNQSGLIETVGSGIPRIDFQGNTKGALLLEPSRTNSITYSNDLNASGWNTFSVDGGTVARTLNYGISPSGKQDSTRVVFDTQFVSLYYSFSGISGDASATMYVKGGAGKVIAFGFGSDVSFGQEFTLNGQWQRIEFNATSTNTTLNITAWGSTRTASDIEVYGVQLEAGSYATSYIPTSGSAVTRVAEQGIDCGAGVNIFSNTSAVWFIDLERIGIDADSSGSAMALRNSSFNQHIRLHFNPTSADIRFRDGLNGFATIGTITGMNPNVRKKIALRIDGSTLSTFANGSKIGSDYTAPSSFNIQEIDFSSIGFELHNMKFYNTALTDAELIALTS